MLFQQSSVFMCFLKNTKQYLSNVVTQLKILIERIKNLHTHIHTHTHLNTLEMVESHCLQYKLKSLRNETLSRFYFINIMV